MKSTIHKYLILTLAIAAALSGCKSENAVPSDPGYTYFPTAVGTWVEYEVDSTFVDEQFGGDTVHVEYLMRIRLESEYTDLQGRIAQRIERMVLDTMGNWVVRDVWSQTRDNFTAERTEENLRKMRMTFPVRTNVTWDLNTLNTLTRREMTYQNIHSTGSAGSLSFDSTVTVETTFTNNLIDTVFDTERYAKHVGMVYKRLVETNTQYVSVPNAPPEPRTTGIRFTMTAVAYGGQ